MDSGTVTLRPFRVSDVDDFILWAGDDQVTRNIRWKTITSKEEALTFIKEVCIPHPWRRSICIDDRSIGFVSVYRWSGNEICKADIAYGIAAKYWGQGITTKAVKMAVLEVFKDFPDLVRLQAFAAVENKASQRVLEKAGFTKEGLLRKSMETVFSCRLDVPTRITDTSTTEHNTLYSSWTVKKNRNHVCNKEDMKQPRFYKKHIPGYVVHLLIRSKLSFSSKRMGYYWPTMVEDPMNYAKNVNLVKFMQTLFINL
uniref:N-acetyltransferase domain-containing protein n=1 Tax=Vitis vinifera TaxID=29760 RepID=A5ASW5_VITVI|nr:hypothetical protein VITISV_027073 [Vitis vinifera]